MDRSPNLPIFICLVFALTVVSIGLIFKEKEKENEMEKYKVKTSKEMIYKIFDGSAAQGDVCECEELQSTFVFDNKGWTCVKTRQKGYEHLYSPPKEQ